MVPIKVLITGCAGLLGSRLAEYIVSTKLDVKVYGIDDLSGGFLDNVDPLVHFTQMDITDHESIDRYFQTHQFDYVYHMAAYAAECLSPFIRRYNYMNNLVGSANIINACVKYDVKRLVFTSTMAVYGHGVPPFHEDAVRNPVDPYGIAKAAVERDIEIASEQHGLDYCIIRPHNVYGRNQNIWDSYRNVLGIWMYKQLNGDPLTIYGDGSQVRAFSCIDDSLEPLWQSAVSPTVSRQIINLGGITETSIIDAAHTLCDVMGGGEIIFLEPRHEVKHAYPTWQKSVDLLGFEHKTSLHDGLADMWEWAKRQPKRDRFIWSGYELEKGIYSYWKPDALRNGYWKQTNVQS